MRRDHVGELRRQERTERNLFWLLLLAVGCNDNGNFFADWKCICQLGDGGSALVDAPGMYCDQSEDDVRNEWCPKQRFLSDAGCVSLTNCACELSSANLYC
jgi:hypothetical protein